MMPRIAWVLLVGACSFDAVYDGHYTCSDGQCPSGYTCNAAKQCVMPGTIDAARGSDGGSDARLAALTCADPGVVPAAGATETGTTVGRSNTVSAMCGGLVFNGPDAIYRFDAASAGTALTISIAASYAANAYVIAPCTLEPATPACVGNAVAAPAAPLAFSAPAAGAYFIVVDGVEAALDGAYTLTIANP